MEKEIITALENRDMEKSKELILSYERKISEEKAVFTRSKMIEKLNYFKKLYNCNKEENNFDVRMQVIDRLKNIESNYVEEITSKLFFKDKRNTRVQITNLFSAHGPKEHLFPSEICNFNTENTSQVEKIDVCRIIDCEIWNCSDSIIERLRVEQTVQIEDTSNCTIQVEAKQIRIKDSSNLNLFIYVHSGISIENCSNIRIFGLNDGRNKFKNVNDFSDPFGSKNYSVRSFDQKL